MTTQEIADYLEANNYPMNSINDLSTDRFTLVTGIKGGYLFSATLIEWVHKECDGLFGTEKEPITPAYLDRIIAARKQPPKSGDLLNNV